MTKWGGCMKIKSGLLFSAVLAAACALLIFPAQASQGAQKGVGYSLNILIPSLYPFMVLSVFVVKSGLARKIGRALNRPTQALLRLPGEAAASVLMSAIGGYPAGARSIAALREEGLIDRDQAEQMVCFCVNAGPSFVITAVGVGFLKSAQAGTILFVSQMISFLLMGLLCGAAMGKRSRTLRKQESGPPIDAARALIASASDAAYSTLMMCCFVILFASFMGLLRTAVKTRVPAAILSAALEVTGGCSDLASLRVPLWAVALAIGWGGLCVHFQVLACLGDIPISRLRFAACRLLQGMLSAAVCFGLTQLFPECAPVFSNISGPVSAKFSGTVPSAAALALMCLALLLNMPHEKLEIQEQ